MTTTMNKTAKRKTDFCIFCGEWVNLDDEGVTYGNGACAHDGCHDGNEFAKANEADFRD